MSAETSLLRTWAPKISAALQDLPELADVQSVSEGGTQQVMLQIDREAARRLGVAHGRLLTSRLGSPSRSECPAGSA